MLTLTRYVRAVSIAGCAALAAMLVFGGLDHVVPTEPAVWVFAICLVLGECLPMRLVHHGLEGEITTSSTFAIALLLTAGMPVTAVAVTLAALVADLRQRKRWDRVVFNVGQYAITVACAGLVLRAAGFDGARDVLAPDHLPAAVLAAVTFFVVNALLVARAVALAEGTSFLGYLRTDLEMQTSTVGILLGLGPVVVAASQFTLWTLPLLGLPLFALYRSGRRAVLHQRDALHDPLTGLPNRALLRERLERGLTLRERDDASLAVVFVDLDGFKEINDTLGHHQGDELLCDVGTRLGTMLGEEATLARLGGDEFAVVLPHVETPEAAVAVARRLGDVLEPPFTTGNGIAVEVRASFGVALSPQDGVTAEELLRRADIAMYQAKETGGGERRYSPASDRTSPDRLTLVAELRESLEADGLVVHYQPKADAVRRDVAAVEALVRWPHPRLGMLGPDSFIDLAERSGLIRSLTSVVLEHSLREARRWLETGSPIGVGVNLSPDSLRDHRIVDEVRRTLETSGMPARLLTVEVTEGMLLHDPGRAREVLQALRALGVGVSLDDFGTGFSSLAHLKDLPIDEIKIDRSFVAGVDRNAADLAIVRSTITLAHDLGLRVVAEGVETPRIADELERLGCDVLQGYLIGRPGPARELPSRTVPEVVDLPGLLLRPAGLRV